MDLAEFLRARLDEDQKRAELRRTYAAPEASYYRGDGSARPLREVEAKRVILAAHSPSYPVTYPEPAGQPTCSVCHAGGYDWDPENWPCATVRAVAAVWSDHPDYQQE